MILGVLTERAELVSASLQQGFSRVLAAHNKELQSATVRAVHQLQSVQVLLNN